MISDMYYTYIIECADNTLYTGVAKILEKRMLVHSKKIKQTAKYTRSHTYKSLMCAWESIDRSTAQKLEYRIKRLTRIQKLELIENNDNFEVFFPTLDASAYKRIEKATV